MAQRLLALGLIAAGAVSVVLGVGSATLWRPADSVTATALPTGDGTFVVTEPGVLDLVDESVTVTAKSPNGGKVVLAVGRDIDVAGWAGNSPRTDVTGLKNWDTLSTKAVTSKPAASASATGPTSAAASPSAKATASLTAPATASGKPSAAPTAASGADVPESAGAAPDPAGSDMWLNQESGQGSASLKWTDRPGRWSLIAAGVGEKAKAPTVTMTWPRSVSTPWLWVGIIVGGLLIIAGALLRIVNVRSDRARKQGKLPGMRARLHRERATDPDQTDATPPAGRRSRRRDRAENPSPEHSDADTTTLPAVRRKGEPAARGNGEGAGEPVPSPAHADAADPSGPLVQVGAEDTQVLPPARTRRELRERAEAARKARESGTGATEHEEQPGEQRGAPPAGQASPPQAPSVETQAPPSRTVRGDAWRRSWGIDGGGASPDKGTMRPDQGNGPPRQETGPAGPIKGAGQESNAPDEAPPAPRPRHGKTDGTQEDR